MYSLIAIFAIVPLIFSHIFVRISEDFLFLNGIGSFESVKMPFFLTLVVTALVEIGLTRRDFWSKKTLFLLSATVLFLATSALIFPYDSYRDFLLGIGEKQHGILLPVALVWIGYLMTYIEKKEYIYFSRALIATGSLIATVSILEGFFGYNIFRGESYTQSGTWGAIRATATLGNPNYVAGYLLAIIPLIFSLKRSEKYLLIGIFALGILASGSIIGIGIFGLLLSYRFFVFSLKSPLLRHISIVALISVTIVTLALKYSHTEKWLSLESRGVLMRESVTKLIEDPRRILLGHGSEGVIRMYETGRSRVIDDYFPTEATIDSSHNIFLDILIKYGLFGLVLGIGYVLSRWKYLGKTSREGIILLFAFFSLNVIVVSHWIVLVFYTMKKGE